MAMMIAAADRTISGNGSVGAAAGAESGRDDHKDQHRHGHLIRGVASQVIVVDDEGHPDPFIEEGSSGCGGRALCLERI